MISSPPSPPIKNAVLRKAAAKRHRPEDAAEQLFRRNCWISFEPVENSIAVLADYIGPHKIMWATDYPHQDGFFPRTPEMIRERLAPLSPEAKHQVLAGGAMGFYGLH
jgi:predicted TIM-barrel fold metal-dependent hydrolase